MERQELSSTSIRSAGYARETRILEVEFAGGRVYQYFGIPEELFDGLVAAISHGGFFDENIKKAGFRFEKMQ